MAGLDETAWRKVKRMLADGCTIPLIAAKFGVTEGVLKSFIAEQRRRHLAVRDANGHLPPDRMPVARLKREPGWDFSRDDLEMRD